MSWLKSKFLMLLGLSLILQLSLFTKPAQAACSDRQCNIAGVIGLSAATMVSFGLMVIGFTVKGIRDETGLCKGSKTQYCCDSTCKKMPPNTTACGTHPLLDPDLYCTNATGNLGDNPPGLISDEDVHYAPLFIGAGFVFTGFSSCFLVLITSQMCGAMREHSYR